MANDPISDAARQFQPLGELLLSRGLITPQQLQEALAEQAQNRRPLGEIIVTRGFASGPMIAQALATQQGRMFKSEYGYATGFSATIHGIDDEADAPPVTGMSGETVQLAPAQGKAAPLEPLLRIVPAPQQGGLDTTQDVNSLPELPAPPPNPAPVDGGEVNALRERLAGLTQKLIDATASVAKAEEARVAAVAAGAETEAARSALEETAARQAEQISALELEVVQAKIAAESRSSETGDLHGRISELEEELDSARREREEVSGRSAAELADTTARLESRIEQLQAELAEAEQRTRNQETAILTSYHRTKVAHTQQVEPQPEIEGPYHLFFLVAGDGYVLIERTGTLPEVGAVVDLSDDGGPTGAVVAKIAPSPLPQSTLDCAYLI